eukprot:scaffold146_cov374-Prasinococcus_capsulatus_cf.AAC.5
MSKPVPLQKQLQSLREQLASGSLTQEQYKRACLQAVKQTPAAPSRLAPTLSSASASSPVAAPPSTSDPLHLAERGGSSAPSSDMGSGVESPGIRCGRIERHQRARTGSSCSADARDAWLSCAQEGPAAPGRVTGAAEACECSGRCSASWCSWFSSPSTTCTSEAHPGQNSQRIARLPIRRQGPCDAGTAQVSCS